MPRPHPHARATPPAWAAALVVCAPALAAQEPLPEPQGAVGADDPPAALPPDPLDRGLAGGVGPEAELEPVPRLDLLRRPRDVPRPVVDGRLDDPLWGLVPPRTDFRQVVPTQLGAPSERTELRVAYDEQNLYVIVRCFDREPEGIRGTQMRRDANLDPDDRVEVLIDPFFSRRDAFWFQIGPSGGKGDALIGRNGSRFEKSWDGLFEADSTWDDEGWTCEFAIPFATTGFDPDTDRFGLNVRRFIRRKEETVQWSRPLQRIGFFSVADAGVLTGIGGLEPSLGLDVRPFGVARYDKDDPTGDVDRTGDVGLDLFWRLRPGTKLSVSLNTDFAETEVDARQVNLTRFPLFFPEQRDFFLEDSSAFVFGPPGASGGGSDLIPFFSRRIGLDDQGQQVPLLGAAKLTSSGEGYTFGALSAQTDAGGDPGSLNLSAARGSFDLFDRSDVGFVVTNGDPDSEGDAVTAGADLNLRTERFLGDRNLRFSSYLVGTDNEDGDRSDTAFLAELDYPNDTVQARATYVDIGEEVDPALGFVPRTGIKRYEGAFRWLPRPGTAIRQIGVGYFPTYVTGQDDELQSERHALTLLDVQWEQGEELDLFVQYDREVLLEDFEISDGVVIPLEDYAWWKGGFTARTSDRRPWDVTFGVTTGDFWDGERTDVSTNLGWRPNRFLELDLDYDFSRVDLPGGEFDVHVARLRSDIAITRWIAISSFVQWDNQSDQLGLNSRLRWILSPGNEFFFVVNQAWEAGAGEFTPRSGQVATKLGWTFRF